MSLPGPGEVGSDYSHMDNRSRKLLAGAEIVVIRQQEKKKGTK
jgi:hypothetical protein